MSKEMMDSIESSSEALEEMGYKQELKRALTVPDMIAYGLIFMVPIAPFGIYGDVFNGSGGMPSLVYLIGMVAMIFTAVSYATLSREFPVSGSVYGYTSRGVGKGVGFVTGWTMLLDYMLVPTLLYVVAAQAMSGLIPGVPTLVWGLIFVVFNTFVNVRGIELTALLNRIALVAEIIVLVVFLVMGIWWLATDPLSNGFTLQPFYNAETFSMDLVMGAVSLGVLSFLGFDAIATLSEEAKDAKRGPSRAMVISLLLVGVMFMAQTYIAGCLSPDGAVFADDPDNAFYLVASIAGGKFLYALCAVATAIAWGIFDALAAQTAIARILYAMSRDRLMPKALAKIHDKYKTPYVAAIFIGALSIVLVVIFNSLGIAAISSCVNFGALTAFMILNLTIIYYFMFRKKSKNILRHLIVPVVGFFIIGYVWISLDSLAMTLGISWVIIGTIYYLILHFGLKRDVKLDEF